MGCFHLPQTPLVETPPIKTLQGKSSSVNSNDVIRTSDKSPRVRFLNVTISEHPIIVGDNPGGNKGPPVTIAWESVKLATVDIDQFEKARQDERRDFNELKMPPTKRRSMLLDLGFTPKEINQGLKAANITRAQRRHTIAKLNQSESFRRNVASLFKNFRATSQVAPF